jgi:hypothetical protein
VSGCNATEPTLSIASDEGERAPATTEQDIRDVVLEEWDVEEVWRRVKPLLDAAPSITAPPCSEPSSGSIVLHDDFGNQETIWWCGEPPPEYRDLLPGANVGGTGYDSDATGSGNSSPSRGQGSGSG